MADTLPVDELAKELHECYGPSAPAIVDAKEAECRYDSDVDRMAYWAAVRTALDRLN